MQVGRDAELRGHVLRDDRPGGGQSGAGAVPAGAVASEGGSMINGLSLIDNGGKIVSCVNLESPLPERRGVTHATSGACTEPGEVGVAERRLAGREEVVRVGRGRRGRRGGVSRRHED